jgi:uncharacterized membrane protein
MEAFSDGVFAIIITIMVLEIKVPHGDDLSALRPLLPVFISYVLSFIFLGIYWNNHHHMLQASQKVSGGILWANSHLLFWLSLIPFATNWMGEHEFSSWPVALYGLILLCCAIAYTILARLLVLHHGIGSALAHALGSDLKGYLSLAIYACAIPLAFFFPLASYACYVLVAGIWLYPDSRIEKELVK